MRFEAEDDKSLNGYRSFLEGELEEAIRETGRGTGTGKDYMNV